MSRTLMPLDEALRPVLRRLGPLAPRTVGVETAPGSVLAEPVLATRALPPRALALRSGLAVASLDLVGASTHSPAILAREPRSVAAGEPLPEGCDAVVDPAAVTRSGAMILVADAAAPGLNARLSGQDQPAGAMVAPAGVPVTHEVVLACRLLGVRAVSVRQPTVSIALGDDRHSDWLCARLSALGCTIARGNAEASLLIKDAASAEPRLALVPGDAAGISVGAGGCVEIDVPRRFDALLATYAALMLPALARLTGQMLAETPLALTRKLSSSIGHTELALLRTRGRVCDPLAIADLTVAAMAEADAFCLVRAGAEGHAQDETVGAISFGSPFARNQHRTPA